MTDEMNGLPRNFDPKNETHLEKLSPATLIEFARTEKVAPHLDAPIAHFVDTLAAALNGLEGIKTEIKKNKRQGRPVSSALENSRIAAEREVIAEQRGAASRIAAWFDEI